MIVLITNNTLAARAGSELFVRDLAVSLQARGHRPIACSALLGEVAEQLRATTIPVIERPSDLTVRPDIIHGHHHLETMLALLSIPGVPAVYFCHGWLPWEEKPPIFPRIIRYVAVDRTCYDRVVIEQGIREDRVSVILNSVDLQRFPARRPLPIRPKKALVFSNTADERTVQTIKIACEPLEIEVDVVGMATGNASSEPERLLGNYDLVFARGRAALEAMAVGTAVVLCDYMRCGPMVSSENFDTLRPLNFGIRSLQNPLTAALLSEQIACYDRHDAELVHRRIRKEASLEDMTTSIVNLYDQVISDYREMPRHDIEEELRAAGLYLDSLMPTLKSVYSLRDQVNSLQRNVRPLSQAPR
ncbi:MAG: glycosyltransferase [Candidatus Binataceae bacterium]